METFNKPFGSLLAWRYHCFDRLVIQGYTPLLTDSWPSFPDVSSWLLCTMVALRGEQLLLHGDGMEARSVHLE
jgi:hypothetical protein